jgi:hypothetical protein
VLRIVEEFRRRVVLLFEALDQTRRHADLALAYTEAWERGPAWQDGIRFGVGMFSEAGRSD